jgi:hypothetical protein
MLFVASDLKDFWNIFQPVRRFRPKQKADIADLNTADFVLCVDRKPRPTRLK